MPSAGTGSHTNATSLVASARPADGSSQPTSRSEIRQPGARSRNRAIARRCRSRPTAVCIPTTRVRGRPIARHSAYARSQSARIRRAAGSSAAPCSVSARARGRRSNSSKPSLRSSALICLDSAGCDTNSRAAARVKFSSSATAAK